MRRQRLTISQVLRGCFEANSLFVGTARIRSQGYLFSSVHVHLSGESSSLTFPDLMREEKLGGAGMGTEEVNAFIG